MIIMKMGNKTIRKYIYIDKGDKRLFRLMMVSILSLFVVALTTPYEANAQNQSGQLTIDATTGNSYVPEASTSSNGVTFLWTKMFFDSAHYNKWNNLLITFESNWVFAQEAESTSFTITSGGTGSGFVSYNKNGRNVFFDCGGCTITSSPVTISYGNNILNNITLNVQHGGTAAITTPIYFGGADTTISQCNSQVNSGCAFQTSTSMVFSNNYNVNYTNIGSDVIANVSIDKSISTVQSKVSILNSTDTKFSETSFNTNSYSFSFIYDTGISLNMTDAAGNNDFVVVNSTGAPGVPTPTPTAQPPFTSTDSINTTKGIYNNTESVDIFGSFYPATTTQTDCLFFGFICTDTTINIESNTGYVFISTQGSTSPIQFLSFTPDKNNNYDLLQTLDVGTYQAQLYGFAEPGSTCPSGVVFETENLPLGCFYPHNITTFQVVNNTPGLFIHWQTRLPNTSAYYGTTITVAWNNVTANDIVKIYDNTGTAVQTYPINISNVNQIPVFIPLYTVGTWNATIFNGSNLSQSASAFLNVLPPGAISVNNSFGISMYWSKAADIVDNPTTLNWNTGSYSGLYFITVTLNGQEVRNNSYTAVPGQTQKGVYSFDTQGTYVAQLLDINGTIQAQADIQISQLVAQPTSTEPIPSGSEASQSLGNNLITFMGMPAFWGLILWIIVVYAISSSSASGSTALVAFIMANMEAVIGLWSPFTWYILSITWIFAGIYFYFGQEMSQPR